MFEQKKTKQDEQKNVYSLIESPEVTVNDPLAPYRPHIDNFDLTEEQKLELVNTIVLMADIILDAKFAALKRPHNLQKQVDDKADSINGVRHEN